MRHLGSIGRLVPTLAAVAMVVILAVGPAHAAVVVTTTQTFVNSAGNTVTVTETRIDGVLSAMTYNEVTPSGVVVLERSVSYYSTGQISRIEETRRLSNGSFESTLIRNYDLNGIVREQYAEVVLLGETIGEQFLTFDASGYLVEKEQRVLSTLADGTRVWTVIEETWTSGVLVSRTTTEYPYGYDFDGGDDPVEALPQRPGNGYGDENHEHTGPPGQDSSASADHGGGNGADQPADEATESRPGEGHGDRHHGHTGAPGQSFSE